MENNLFHHFITLSTWILRYCIQYSSKSGKYESYENLTGTQVCDHLCKIQNIYIRHQLLSWWRTIISLTRNQPSAKKYFNYQGIFRSNSMAQIKKEWFEIHPSNSCVSTVLWFLVMSNQWLDVLHIEIFCLNGSDYLRRASDRILILDKAKHL